MTNDPKPEREGSRLIAAAIKDCQERSGYSVAELAARVKTNEGTGIQRQTLYDIMNGKNTTLEMIENIFEACGDSFGRWLEGQWKYGKDNSLHKRLQQMLDGRDKLANAVRVNVEALWTLYTQEQKQRRKQQGRE